MQEYVSTKVENLIVIIKSPKNCVCNANPELSGGVGL